jgi:short-subunit dehydrogenase
MTTQPVIIITGASSGIGEAAVRTFAKAGYRVVAAARRLDRLQSLAQQMETKRVFPVQADVCKNGDIDQLVRASLDHFGQIDVLVNNAGIGRFGWLETLPDEDIEHLFRTNLMSVIYLSRAVLPHMIERRSGVIINMASIASFIGTPTYSLYAASKFAIRGFTEALRREVNIYGIKVCGIYPGTVFTDFALHAGLVRKSRISTPKALRLSSEEVADALLSLSKCPRRTWILPWQMYFAIWANSLLPGLVDWAIERRFIRHERSTGSG